LKQSESNSNQGMPSESFLNHVKTSQDKFNYVHLSEAVKEAKWNPVRSNWTKCDQVKPSESKFNQVKQS